MRNGMESSQTIGYRTSASSARGQHKTNRMHHNRNPAMIPPPSLTTTTPKTAEKFRASRSSAGAIFAPPMRALPLPVAYGNLLPARRGLFQAREPAPGSSLPQAAAEAK